MNHRLFVLITLLAAFYLPACSDAAGAGAEGTDSIESSTSETADFMTTCTVDADCDDSNSCTTGFCKSDGTCEQVPRTDEPCDDGDVCTEDETCQSDGACGGGAMIAGFEDSCQTCTCDPVEGLQCDVKPAGSTCDDGDCCSVGDTCMACAEGDPECAGYGLKCVGNPKCGDDDGNPCVLNVCSCDDNGIPSCNEGHAPDGLTCDFDSNDCTMGDTCLAGECIKAPPLPLDDENPCTEDECVKGEIVHTPLLTGQCDDGNECTTDDHCVMGQCTGGEMVACSVDLCVSAAECIPGEGCVETPMPAGAICDDANACSLNPSCTEFQTCEATEFKSCDDGNPCTADSCNPLDGTCDNAPSELLDGLPCQPEANYCASEGSCESGVCVSTGDQDCDDNNPCTEDSCDPTGGCHHEPIDGECEDGHECTLNDSCVDGQCAHGEWSQAIECNPPPPCSNGDDVVNCHQDNGFDDGQCCCWAEDPTGAYQSGHVLDLGEIEAGTTFDCCVQTGFAVGCEDTTHIDVSTDGFDWTPLTTLETISSKDDDGEWVQQCETLELSETIRFIRGGNNTCYLDFFSCTLPCEDEYDCDTLNCDDGNACTEDICDPTTGCFYHVAPDSNGTPCDSANLCAAGGECHAGECIALAPFDTCDDDDDCTTDSCDPDTGCQNIPILDCDLPVCGSQVAEFDGSSCIEVAGIMNDSSLSTYTVEFWLQPFDDDKAHLLETLDGEGFKDIPGWRIQRNDLSHWYQNLHYQEAKEDGNFHGVLSTKPYPINTWKHYALQRTASGMIRVYNDGVAGSLGSFNNASFVLDQSSSAPLWIGCRDNVSDHFNGRIDELRISSVERYSGSFEPPTAPLEADADTVLLFHFDDEADGIVWDSSGNGWHGAFHGQDSRPEVSPVLSTCDDGDPCTLDACDGDVGCVHSPDSTVEGCDAPVVTCPEDELIDSGVFLPFQESHTVDLGVMVEPGQAVECCVRPGYNCGCDGEATIEISTDQADWSTAVTAGVVSDKVEDGCNPYDNSKAWVDVCYDMPLDTSYQYVKGTVTTCYNDYFSCTLKGTVCDDGNRCTLDSCDAETGECVYTPFASPTCLLLYSGNNLISFHALPEDASLQNVFGGLYERIDYIFSEAVGAYGLSNGHCAGNIRQLERQRSYWIHMDLSISDGYSSPSGFTGGYTSLPLDGEVTAPDLRYQLHEGTNMISFSGGEFTSTTDAIPNDIESYFEAVIGQGMAIFQEAGTWIGSLTSLGPNKGYQFLSTQAISDYQYDIEGADGPDSYSYGCTHPQATNYLATARIDDASCTFGVPSDWTIPIETGEGQQLLAIFQAPSIDGAPMEADDAIGAFVNDANVGFGFIHEGFVTVPVMNMNYTLAEQTEFDDTETVVIATMEVTFKVFDASTGGTSELPLDSPMEFQVTSYNGVVDVSNPGFMIVGCQDASASNHLPEADLGLDVCEP